MLTVCSCILYLSIKIYVYSMCYRVGRKITCDIKCIKGPGIPAAELEILLRIPATT